MSAVAAWFAGNRVAAFLVSISVVIAGIHALLNAKIEVFPAFESETITVSVLYPGASPAEVEEGIVIKIEEVLQEISGLTEQSFSVSAVPDEMKGERLVVLHTVSDSLLAEAVKKLQQSELPKLWIPRANQFFKVDQLP